MRRFLISGEGEKMAIEDLTDEILFSLKGGVATVTLNRPDKLNACTAAMYNGIVKVADEVRENDEIKVLVVTGAGPGFCAGSDAKSRLTARAQGKNLEQSRWELVQPVGYFGAALHKVGKPTIAAVNGACVGAGLSIALLCDIRIASEKARFGAVWVRRGLVPDVGATYLLPRTVGLDRALELCFTGEVIDAREAERIGLVTRVVAHDDLVSVVNRLACTIAEGPSVAIELMKRGMYRAVGGDYDAQLDFESYAQNLCFKTEDFKEGTAAFLEKRDARFKGR
jgi:2-(1,2-epoxy-1,2-dihydrophenyl)acetyl-CoA isomerase